MTDANTTPIKVSVDPLNVMQFDVPPLSAELLSRIERGRTERTIILDSSELEQHDGLPLYADTHVKMRFVDEGDLIKCVRLLQWSDERMRKRTDPVILWKWKEAYRIGDEIEFSVSWYSKDFFESRKDSFLDSTHSNYYGIFGMKPSDLAIEHEIYG